MVTFPTFWQLFTWKFLSPTRHELAEAGWSMVDEVSRLKAENAALWMENRALKKVEAANG